MSRAIISLIKPLQEHQTKAKQILVTPYAKKLAYEVCEILRGQEVKWEDSLKNRFFEEEMAPAEIAHLVFDKIRDVELGLKFFHFLSINSFTLNGLVYSSLLKLLARSKVFKEMDNVLSECTESEEMYPTFEVLDFLIRVYADSGMVSKSLELYSFVLKTYGVLPRLFACNSLLNGLVKDGNLEAARLVYDEMERRDRSGENGCLDNFSVCIIVKGFCKAGKVEKGKRLIERRWGRNCIPNVVFYNTLIDGYCKKGNVTIAYELFEELKAKAFLPNQDTYGSIINGFCKKGEFEKVDKILEEMELSGTKINVHIYNCIIDALCKCGFVCEALGLVRKMTKVGCKLDIVTYNTLIANACRDGKLQEAGNLLEEAVNNGLLLNERTFTPLIHAICQEGDFDRASSLLLRMVECGLKPDLVTYGGFIHGLVVSGELDVALSIRDKMMEMGVNPDAWIYNILLNGLCKKGRFTDAKKLVLEMLDHNISPDAYVYATLVDGYIRNGDFSSTKKLFNDIISKGAGGLVVYNAMIKGYCKFGMLKDAVLCLNTMSKRNMCPDEYTYSTIIDGYIKLNDVCSALAMFCHIIKLKRTPNVVTYTSLMNGFCRCGDIAGAERILKELRSNGITPNVVTYTVLIAGCCKEGKLAKACLFFEEMLVSKCYPNNVTYHYLVNGLSNAPRDYDFNNKPMILDIFGKMASDGWDPIHAAYISIIACLSLHKMLETALQLTDKMNKGFPRDSVTLAALLHGICLRGKSKEWQNLISFKLVEPKMDVAFRYLSIFGRYSTPEATKEASLILQSLFKECNSDG